MVYTAVSVVMCNTVVSVLCRIDVTQKAISPFRGKRENNKVEKSKCTEKTQSAC